MARISTYTTDSSIDGTEFLLGRESDGTTKQFSLSALQTYLATVISSTQLLVTFGNTTTENISIPLQMSLMVIVSLVINLRVLHTTLYLLM